MQMSLHYALVHLGLTWNNRANPEAICKAWRQRHRSIHPDKSTSPNATEQAQRLNHARDVLMAQLIDPELNSTQEGADEEEQRIMDEKRKEEEKRLSDLFEEIRQKQRERFIKNRRKRAADTRPHRKTSESEQGTALVEELSRFFSDNFIQKPEGHMYMFQAKELFFKARGRASGLDKRLFHRHARSLLIAAWPCARYIKHKKRWGFLGICFADKN